MTFENDEAFSYICRKISVIIKGCKSDPIFSFHHDGPYSNPVVFHRLFLHSHGAYPANRQNRNSPALRHGNVDSLRSRSGMARAACQQRGAGSLHKRQSEDCRRGVGSAVS